jgi:tetratricopeptide (TPR) repeat protein
MPKAPKLADALKAFESAVKLFQRGNFTTAREAFEKLRERYPNQTEILARAQMYLNICELRLKTPARPPQTPDALYDQGVVEMNRAHFDAAIDLFKRALKALPQQPHVLYSLAAAQVRSGDADEGLRTLERAVEAKELNRSHARNDPDFAALRGDTRFQELVGLLGL